MTTQLASVSVEITNGQPTTTSLDVAAHFGKQHKDVLRAINSLDCSPEFTQRNFAPCTRPGSNNKPEPYFRLTRDGFTFLCMGFTGKEAAKWKEAYINAFNQMEAEIKAAPAPAKAPRKAKPKALPNGLTPDQQVLIQGVIKERLEELPQAKRGPAAIRCWSALKTKFGCSYKEIPPEQFTDAISTVARVVLEGELLQAEQPQPASTIRMPLEWLFENNPRLNRERPLIMRPHGLVLSMGTLGTIDHSAVDHLLDQLAALGADVAAPRAEIEAWRHFAAKMFATAAMVTDQAKRMADHLNQSLGIGVAVDRQSGRTRR